MEHLRAAGGCRQCGAAGIGEQVQYPHRPSGCGNLLTDEIPVRRLLREHAGMLEIHGLDVKGQIIPVFDLPALRQFVIRPVAAASVGTNVPGIKLPPFGSSPGGVPDHLGVWANQDITAPAFQTLSARRIQNLVVLPLIGNPQHILPSSLSSRFSAVAIDPVIDKPITGIVEFRI